MNLSETMAQFACPPNTWNHNCTPCSQCDINKSITLSACTPHLDTLCHYCLPGFHPINGTTCQLIELDLHLGHVDTRYPVVVFIILLLEILVCAGWWRWWLTHHHYKTLDMVPERP